MSGKSKLRIAWSLLAMLVLTTACAGAPPVPVEVGRGAAVEFVNESLERAEVYVVVPAIDAHHLGVAMPGERRFFVVPEEVLRRGNGSISILAVIPVHGARRNSGLVATQQGDTVRVILPKGVAQLIVDLDGK